MWRLLWQPLVTKTNRDTSNKSQRQISLWRSQENSTKSLLNCYPIYISYKWSMLTNLALKPMCCPCLILSFIRTLYYIYVPWHYLSSSFSQSLGLWPHIMWCIMWLLSCASSSSIKEKEKENQKKRNIKSRKIDKRKRKMLVSKCTITKTGNRGQWPISLSHWMIMKEMSNNKWHRQI